MVGASAIGRGRQVYEVMQDPEKFDEIITLRHQGE